jgi:hypothetical protein
MKPSFRQGYLLLIFCLLAVCFMYVRFAILPGQQTAQERQEQLYQQALERVAVTIGLSKDQVPIRSIVDDVATLKAVNPMFYEQARAGDWVLRYTDTVVLYRSQTNEVITTQKIQATP